MILDPSGRGPGPGQLTLAGLSMIAVLAVALSLLGLRYTGRFEDKVVVSAELTSTGDGLPNRADVKFRGMIVGSVDQVDMVAKGQRQHAVLHLKPGIAGTIPDTVTARVIPDNIFGVSSIQLVDNGPAPTGLREGAVVAEDTSSATIQLQTTLNTLREVLDKIQPEKLGRVLSTFAAALDPGARVPGSTIERLDHWMTQIHGIPEIGDLLGDLGRATSALSASAPELVGVLADSVTAARTLNEHRTQVVDLLTQGNLTVDSVNTLFAASPNAGKDLVAGLDGLFGALAKDPSQLQSAMANLNRSLAKLQNTFNFGPSRQMAWQMNVTFTPFQQYTAEDCPRYGDMVGPRCGGGTVPTAAPVQQYPENMKPGWLDAAGPAPTVSLPTVPGVNLPSLSTLPGLPAIPGLPTIPGLPAIPGITAPSAKPAAASTEPSASAAPISGRAAVTALLGRTPTFSELLLFGPVIGTSSLVARPVEGGAGQ
ncbi:MCE family protein [Nocardia thailandica]